MKAASASPSETHRQQVGAWISAVTLDNPPTGLDRLFSDNHRQQNPQIPNGTAAVKKLLANPPADFEYEPGLAVAEGDHVSIHGRHLRWGREPMVAVDVFRVENGKIAEHWAVMQ